MGRVRAPATGVIRKMVPGDVPRVVAIEAEAFTSPWKADAFEGLLDRTGAELWVLEDPAEGVVGYAVLWCILDQGELANIAIAPTHRGRGLGAYLLERVLDIARGRGVETLYLEVRVSNERAEGLYRAFGFREVGVRRKYYDDPVEDARLMMVRL